MIDSIIEKRGKEKSMQKFKSILIIILMFFLVYFLQVNFFSWFNIAGVMPNLVLFVGLFIGKKIGIVYGLCVGIILDSLVGRVIGPNAILLGIVGYLGEVYDRNFSKNKKISVILLNIVCTVLYEVILYCFYIIKFKINIEVWLFIEKLVVENIYNTLILIIFFRPLCQLGSYLERNFKDRLFLT